MKWYSQDGPAVMEVRMEKERQKIDKNEMSGYRFAFQIK